MTHEPRQGHTPTLVASLLHFDMSFMLWVLPASLAVFIAEDLQLSAALKGLLVAVPILTGSLLRVPIHGAYLLQLHQVSPRLARGYFRTALRLCLARKVSPSLLLHPTDVLSGAEAPGMEFFPGMAVPGREKVELLGWVLSSLRQHFDVVGTGEHVARLAASVLPERDPVACG